MALQIAAIAEPPAPPTGSAHRGIVRSIDSARRRRSHRASSGEVIRVLVVGSHGLSRAGLCRLLDDDGLAVIGEAASADEAAPLVCRTEADVVLLDAGCREPDPAESTRALGGR